VILSATFSIKHSIVLVKNVGEELSKYLRCFLVVSLITKGAHHATLRSHSHMMEIWMHNKTKLPPIIYKA
jgi:hypothetical protein